MDEKAQHGYQYHEWIRMDQNGKGGTRKLYHQGSKSEGPEQGAALLAIIRSKTFLLIIVACDGTLGCEDGSPRSGSDRNECVSCRLQH